ncbi:MAG: hypothetical protein GY734_27740 [Herbaspirillum sp.]|uniref:hypothetical protein n=1 Tax=Herbaspirillum sp. TaxID=1890675 RepID=UPI0025853594|nr:hypothetical protein [Herbaspirillum sp.]MCP3657598.1 hypothetical protein [Herbaspirillum sp.]MCP3949770.1 hypothetical protein [Herbaspirillum sp.]MCP4035021.1 hypothetical protein [Herbaspirillum sp.]MCP4556500.1 hypothetical protein [Herbaspirillum sp.]
MKKPRVILGKAHIGTQNPDGTIEWTETTSPLFHFALEPKNENPFEKFVDGILHGATRSSPLIPHIRSRLIAFVIAKSKIQSYLESTAGDFLVQDDQEEFRVLWGSYLMEGRQLIDKLGASITTLFSLKQRGPNGLNHDAFRSYSNLLRQELKNTPSKQHPLSAILSQFEAPICQFIALRNQEKKFKNTIIESPKIMPDGTIVGGVIVLRDEAPHISSATYSFLPYFEDSYDMIINFTKHLIGNSPSASSEPSVPENLFSSGKRSAP